MSESNITTCKVYIVTSMVVNIHERGKACAMDEELPYFIPTTTVSFITAAALKIL